MCRIVRLIAGGILGIGILLFVPAAQAQSVSPITFGADPNCKTDASSAWTKMVASLRPGTTIDIANHCFLLGNVVVPPNVTVQGALGYGDPFIKAGSGIQTDPYQWGGQIRTIQGTTITASNGARFDNILFIRQGLLNVGVSFPLRNAAQARELIANFGDTAISSDQASVEVSHCTFLGYNYPLYANNSGGNAISDKIRFEWNLVDSVNGLYVGASGDTSHIAFNHIFPFLTIAAPGVGMGDGLDPTPMQRAGSGIHLDNQDTSTTVLDNLSFGYAVGIRCTNCASVTILRNHFENVYSGSADIGMSLSGQYVQASYNFVIGYPKNVYLDSLANLPGNDSFDFTHNQIIGVSVAGNTCIHHYRGYANIGENLLQNCGGGGAVRYGRHVAGGSYDGNRLFNVLATFINGSDEPSGSYIGHAISITNNVGYNPVGGQTIAAPPSGTSYRAGFSPETIYLSGSAGVRDVKQNGSSILPQPLRANVVATFELGPNDTLIPVYSGTLAMRKFVH